MRGNGNYLPPSPFQQNPAAATVPPPPPPFHHAPLAPQPQVIQQGGGFAYPHVPLPGAPYFSSSNFSTSDLYGSSMLVPRHSYTQPLGPLPPPPPLPLPPPPPPTYYPPRIAPLPPSSPPSCNLSMIDGSRSMMGDSSYGDNLVLDGSYPMVRRDNCVDERNEKDVKAADAIATHSPANSDMDMEDDITQPDEEKPNDLSNNLNDACVSTSKELDEKEQLQDSHHNVGNKDPNVSVDGDIIFAKPSGPKGQRSGSEIPSGCDIPVTGKEYSEANGLGLTIRVTEQPANVIIKKSPRHENFSQPTVPVLDAEIGLEKLSSDLCESANDFKLLEGYATESSTENGAENLLQDVSPPTFKVESKTLSKSPRIAIEADKTSVEGGKSNSAKLHVDEFGRLVREGVSDSDTSDSSRHTRKLVRRDRKRSRSSSYSPRDRRRRRRERRGRSRSFSPRRRRSRSRIPVLRRGSEYDKRRRDKGQLEECFDFKMGKCYRGATCRYSHHESYKSERERHNRRKQHYEDTPPKLPNHEENDNLHPSRSSVHDNVRTRDEGLKLPQDMPDLKEVKVADELPAENGSSSTQNYTDKVPQIHQEYKTVEDSLVYESFSPMHASSSALTHLPTVKHHTEHNFNVQTSSVVSPMTIPLITEKVPSQSNLPLPPVSLNFPVAQPISHDYNFRPPFAPFNQKPENYQPYQAPMPYQNSHFPLPPPPPPPPPPRSHSTVNVTTGEQCISSMNMHRSLMDLRNGLPSYTSIRPYPTEFPSQSQTLQYQAYPTVHGPSQIPPSADAFRSRSFPVSNMTGQQAFPHTNGEDRLTGHSVQAMNPSHPVAQSQSNSFHGSIGVNMPSTTNSSQSLPYQFNPYAATFDQPLSTKYDSNVSVQGNDRQFNPMYGASVGFSSVSLETHKIGIVNPASSSARADRPGYDQYDPLFDSIEPPSNSLTMAGLQNIEAIGDSDNFQRSNESSKVLNLENIKQEGDTAVSANESLDFEEFGETADVVNGSPSTPNNAMEMHAGEIEIDQVKASGEKNRSTKLFKISIATFVKDVLKPSWRQGNMSKEAFKTIVKKTVDKVSGAMKSRKIPRSQAKINQYIDSSRGKLTKLVVGYVDKYVKV